MNFFLLWNLGSRESSRSGDPARAGLRADTPLQPPYHRAAAGDHHSDLAWCADGQTWPAFRAHEAARHLYYCVLEGDPGISRAAADRTVTLVANSSPLRRSVGARAGRPVLDGIGGIRLDQFRPEPGARAGAPLRILLNGRRSRPKKGTDLILAALRRLEGRVPAFKTVLLDSLGPENRQDPCDGARLPAGSRFVLDPTQLELVALYQSAHVFVAAERKAGWCNTALEAMACGAAVVCTPSGTSDFVRDGENALVTLRHPWFLRRGIRRVLIDDELRRRLSAAGPPSVLPWSWDRLASR